MEKLVDACIYSVLYTRKPIETVIVIPKFQLFWKYTLNLAFLFLTNKFLFCFAFVLPCVNECLCLIVSIFFFLSSIELVASVPIEPPGLHEESFDFSC